MTRLDEIEARAAAASQWQGPSWNAERANAATVIVREDIPYLLRIARAAEAWKAAHAAWDAASSPTMDHTTDESRARLSQMFALLTQAEQALRDALAGKP